MEYVWMDVQDIDRNWIVNPVAPNKESLVNINAERMCSLTDIDGSTRPARGYAGFAFQAITSTADGYILRPTENVFDPVTRGALPPDPNDPNWGSLLPHCEYLESNPVTPLIHAVEELKKGLFTLGNLTRCITPADEFSPCGSHADQLCVSYSLHGPMKIGYLYGYAGDGDLLNHNLNIASLGGCKLTFQGSDTPEGTLPYAPGFTQAGSIAPLGNKFNMATPSESFIILDGSRAIRIRLNTWFAVISDPAYNNTFALLDTYVAGDTNIFVDNPYIEGDGYSAGLQWNSVNAQGQIVWGSSIQQIGGFSYFTTKVFCEDTVVPPIDYCQLKVLVKTWYYLPPVNGTPVPDPTPDPWSSESTSQAITGQTRGTRPPDETQWIATSPTKTVVSTGDPIFNVDPEYSYNQGYTIQFQRTLPELAYIHLSYYYNDVLVGQKYVKNSSAPGWYSPVDILVNNYVDPGCGFNSGPYPSSANFNLFPFGATGEKCFSPIHSVVTQRNGLTVTFIVVVPAGWGETVIDFGDGTPTLIIAEGASASHTYGSAGTYKVTSVCNQRQSQTYYEVKQ